IVPMIEALVQQMATETPAGDAGSLDDPLFRAARALFAVLFAVAAALMVRAATRWRSLNVRWLLMGVASFGGAQVLRASLPFSLGNWYSEVLPALGPPPWMRFG